MAYGNITKTTDEINRILENCSVVENTVVPGSQHPVSSRAVHEAIQGLGAGQSVNEIEITEAETPPEDPGVVLQMQLTSDPSEIIGTYTKEQLDTMVAEQNQKIRLAGEKADAAVTKVVNHQTGSTSVTIPPNELHIWGTVPSLDIKFAEPKDSTIENNYMIQFGSGTKPTTLTLPGSVKWIGSKVIGANKTYQISVINNLAVMGGA